MSTVDLTPVSTAFDRYLREGDPAVHAGAARVAYDCVAMAKRILLQNGVKEFAAADVVAMAAVIEARDRFHRSTTER